MGVKRIGNPNFYRSTNVKGGAAWKRLPSSDVVGPPAGNLVDVANGEPEFNELPKPSPELLKRLADSRDWSDLDLSGLDLRYVPAKTGRVIVNGTSFAGSDLRGFFMRGAMGEGVDFSGARTENMVLDLDVQLSDIITDGTFDLENVVVGATRLSFRDPTRLLNYEKAVPSQLGGYGMSFVVDNVDFSGDTISASHLNGFRRICRGNFTDAQFVGDNGKGFPFNESQFDHCVFQAAHMQDARVEGVKFISCDFLDANTSGWAFVGANEILNCSFTNADMQNWKEVKNGGWHKLHVAKSKIDGADLSGVDPSLLREMLRGKSHYKWYTIAEAAKMANIDRDEFLVRVWAGDIETRNNQTLEIEENVDERKVHIPIWVLKNLG
jgi:uncharacterized protein YjbI with pentapeptide repeats